MKAFIDRFSGLVKGTVSGFARIVFKGLILPLMSAAKVIGVCRNSGDGNITHHPFQGPKDSSILYGTI